MEEISLKEIVNEWPSFCKVLSKDWENLEILMYISKIVFLKASWAQLYPVSGSLDLEWSFFENNIYSNLKLVGNGTTEMHFESSWATTIIVFLKINDLLSLTLFSKKLHGTCLTGI